MCSGPCARRARGSMAGLRRSSIGKIPAKTNKLSISVGRRHTVTMRKASLIGLLMSRVWTLLHQTSEQYFAAEYTKARVAVRNVVAPAPQVDPANCLKSPTRVLNFFWQWLKVSAKRKRAVQFYAEVHWLRSARQGSSFDGHGKFASCLFVIKMEGSRYCFGCTKL